MTQSHTTHSRHVLRLLRAVLVILPALLILGSLNSTVFGIPPRQVAVCVPSNNVGGTVHQDYNANGVRDLLNPNEPGVAGVTVTAYDASGAAIASTATITDGTYVLTVTNGINVRVEFTNFPGGYLSGPFGADSATSVTFVQSPNCTVDLGLNVAGQYCQNNPGLATNCYLAGDQAGQTGPVLVSFPYTATGTTSQNTYEAAGTQVGTTWGLAYQGASDSLFAAALMKRHTGFGPGGTGAIYRIANASNPAPGTVSLFLDLNALFPGSAGANPHPSGTNFDIDPISWDPVGKISLGDIDISEDQQTLWAMNLNDRQLYRIPIGVPPVAPPAASISRFPVPNPCAAPGDARPFGIGVNNGLVYVGIVCTAESTQIRANMSAHVYSFNPVAGTFSLTPVLSFPLNYPRRCAVNTCTPGSVGGNGDADWLPWVNTFTLITTDFSFTADRLFIYPQPWLTDIVFDRGNMIIGLRDRFGDQMGYQQRSTNPADPLLYSGAAAGDILRACANGLGGWTLENNAACGGVGPTGGAGTGQGPGNGEFYFGENFVPDHDEISLGGLAQVPGLPDVVETVYDPFTIYEGGTLWLNNGTGQRTKAYRVFDTGANPVTFGKAAGLGDLEVMCLAAPIEIGNRVWLDQNRNGIQDAQTPTGVITPELPIANVTVGLYAPDGVTVLATAVTDANGNYYFSSAPGTSTSSAIYGITGLTFNTTGFIIRLDNAANYTTTGPLANYALTFANNDPSPNGDARDSDGALPTPGNPIGTGNYPQVVFNTGPAGYNDHTYDFGFYNIPTAVELLYFRVDGVSGPHVRLAWATAVEIDNFGFNLYRAPANDFSRAELIHFEPSSIGGSGPGATYGYVDRVPSNGVWWYWLADLDTQGHETRHAPVSAAVGLDALLPHHIYLSLIAKGPP